MIKRYLSWDKQMLQMLMYQFPEKDFSNQDTIFKIVDGSKLTTVPKDIEIDRVIAIEPTANMFLQQGLGCYIVEKLQDFGVDILTLQQHHRDMAHLSSILKTYSTVDWSSASDCVATEVVKFLVPPNWFMLLDCVRCKAIAIDGVSSSFSCFSTMGNGTTFVLETLIFYSIAAAVSELHPRSRLINHETFKNISVFGDDCIIKTEFTDEFLSVMASLGFILNKKKTFMGESKFRESCGGDFLSGRNVRPYFLKAPQNTKRSVLRAWLYKTWNGVLKMLINSIGHHRLPYLTSVHFLAQCISRYNDKVFIVALSDPDDSGMKTFGDFPRLKYLFRDYRKCFSKHMVDIHGTVVYQKLINTSNKDGSYFDSIEYLTSLKRCSTRVNGSFSGFMAINDNFDSPFSVLKLGCGYVVSSSTDCTGSFVDVI
jgi:hypothetical protein